MCNGYQKAGEHVLYEWLLDYQQLVQKIDYLEYKLDREEAELKRWVYGDLQNVKLEEKSIAAGLEERIKQLRTDIEYRKYQLTKLINLVEKFEGLEHKILKLKYIDELTLDEIAERLNYSSSHIKKKHAELVRLIKFIDEQGII